MSPSLCSLGQEEEGALGWEVGVLLRVTCLLPLPKMPRALGASGLTNTSARKPLPCLPSTQGVHVELDSRTWAQIKSSRSLIPKVKGL